MQNTNISLQQFLEGWRKRNLELVAFALGVECQRCGEIGINGELCDRCGKRLDGEDN